MTAIDMPTNPGFTNCRFGLATNTQTFTSPLTNSMQRITLGGARWQATYSLPAMNKQQAAFWKAFFLLLEGSSNTFNGYDPDNKAPRGNYATSTPLVNGASQTGSSLTIDGLALSTTGILLPGDMASINGELKMTTSILTSNGSGQGTWNFKPALRSSPADDAAITFIKPTCTMILADDMQAMWECNHNGIYQPKTFTAIETFT